MVLDCVLVPSATTIVEVYGPKFSIIFFACDNEVKFLLAIFWVRTRLFGSLRLMALGMFVP